ncbi:regulatory protein RecX [uncultured Bifidobacterium sp.]|uniref:regulatory protein RecX n=1 Tax=uncultured Bifidobacterium sp. TaxID=165187 RepID=UPI0028DBCC3D|nr:regulatory protein RecX [uncultured Bifidobacterium sp.]
MGDRDECREAALRLLDAAPRSACDLSDRLVGKGFPRELSDSVVDRLIEVGLVDDETYGGMVLRSCLGRGMGPAGVRRELRRRGLDSFLTETLVDAAQGRGDFLDAARGLGRAVARRTKGLDREVRLRRFWAAGGRRGHHADVLHRVAEEMFPPDGQEDLGDAGEGTYS